MLKRSIQARCSTNCMALVVVSKPVYSGIATKNPIIDPANAIKRASCALRSPPVAKTATPTIIGSQIIKLNSGKPNSMFIPFYLLVISALKIGCTQIYSLELIQPNSQDGKYTDDHGKCIVIDVTGLETPH